MRVFSLTSVRLRPRCRLDSPAACLIAVLMKSAAGGQGKRAAAAAELPEAQGAQPQRTRLDAPADAAGSIADRDSRCHFKRLASVEVQLVMQGLRVSELIRLARCSRRMLADAKDP